MTYYKVKENPNLVRDSENNCILNTDKNAISKHEMFVKEIEGKKKLERELNTIKEEISELKQLLRLALSRDQ